MEGNTSLQSPAIPQKPTERIKNFIKSPQVFAPILAYLILLGPTLYIYSVGSPPDTEAQVYKGAWFPMVLPSQFARMKDMGMNTVFLLTEQGELAVASIRTAHRNGLKVALTMDVRDTQIPKAADLDIEELNSKIIEFAKFAERYEVEFFSPMNEAEGVFEEDTERWAQDILSKIKEVYHGEVIWNGADVLDIDLSGYDYLGFTITPSEDMTLEDYSQHVDDVLDRALGFAERDNLKGVMFTEFGTFAWAPGHSEEDIARANEIVLERGKGRAVGFFYIYMPGFYGKTEKTEEVISRWYKEILN